MSADTLTHLLLTYRYWILLPLAIIEGPILAIFVGIFIKLNYLSIVPSLIIMIFGDFIPDTAYYYIGRFGYDWKIFKRLKEKLHDESIIMKLWAKHPVKTLFMSKLAFALAPTLLATAGAAKVPYPKFIRFAFLITILQYGTFMCVGYFVGYSYNFIQDVKTFGMFTAAIIILFFMTYTLVKKYASRQIERMKRHEK